MVSLFPVGRGLPFLFLMAGQKRTHAKNGTTPPRTKGEGSRLGRDTSTTARSRKKAQARREVMRELVQIAADQGHPITLGTSTHDALQGCLDRAVALFRFYASRVDLLEPEELQVELPGPGGAVITQPHRWVEFENAARAEVAKLAGMMTSLGIAERKVRIEEAQAALLVASIRDAALEAGIPHDQVRLLGERLRDRLNRPTDVPPTPSSASRSQSPSTSASVGALGPGH